MPPRERASWRILRVGVGFLLASFSSPSHAAYISEILAKPAGSYPVYIELTLQPDDDSPFDLVILDTRSTLQRYILSIFTITPSSQYPTVVLHQNIWPTADISPGFIGGLNLSLGDQFTAVARRLIVFNQVTGWKIGATAPPLDQWADHPSVPDWSDALTFTRNNSSAQSLLNEPIISLGPGNALWRRADSDNSFITGSADSLLWLTPDQQLDPGRVNQSVHHPEPASGLILICVACGLSLRRTIKKPAAHSPQANGQGRT